MVILGIDPGLERMGYGVIEKKGSVIRAIDFGLISTPRIETSLRLVHLYERCSALLQQHKPDCVANEKLFFAKNQTTAMDVAKALGVAQLAFAQAGLTPREFSPPEIKLSVVGNGAAEKKQVQFMVQRLLGLESAPKPDDVADALAVAITMAFRHDVPRR